MDGRLPKLSLTPLSMLLRARLSLGGVEGGHVLGGGDEVHDADAGLHQADDPAESQQPVDPGCSGENRHSSSKHSNTAQPSNLLPLRLCR